MSDSIAIKSLKLRNILSFGDEGQELELGPLNVLIGPNGSGKSNLIEILSLLQAAPSDLNVPIRAGGGINEWLWKGINGSAIAEIQLTVPLTPAWPLRYRLSFTAYGQILQIVDETLEAELQPNHLDGDVFFYRFRSGHPVLNARVDTDAPIGETRGRLLQYLSQDQIDIGKSILSQAVSFPVYPELTLLNLLFDQFHFYRELNFGRFTPPRLPQQADLPNDFLLEDASNLGLVLNSLEVDGHKRRIVELLQRFYEPVSDFTIRTQGGTVQFFLHEDGLNRSVPATRLSDGTLRYLCLLSILLHPNPQSLVCIEEPEIGLHPDVIPTIAELLIEASARTQIIVTTHSETLISALGEHPEAVIVCERDAGGTRMRRLEPDKLQLWLKDYSLGMLWAMGEIGGTRW